MKPLILALISSGIALAQSHHGICYTEGDLVLVSRSGLQHPAAVRLNPCVAVQALNYFEKHKRHRIFLDRNRQDAFRGDKNSLRDGGSRR